jgi:hypothetical protein
MIQSSVIYVDFRQKKPAAHVPVPAAEYLPRARMPLLVSSTYLMFSSMAYALACWLASLVLLLTRWP